MGDIFSSIISTFCISYSKTIIINYHKISLEIEFDILLFPLVTYLLRKSYFIAK